VPGFFGALTGVTLNDSKREITKAKTTCCSSRHRLRMRPVGKVRWAVTNGSAVYSKARRMTTAVFFPYGISRARPFASGETRDRTASWLAG
jgi:hypothetical protein